MSWEASQRLPWWRVIAIVLAASSTCLAAAPSVAQAAPPPNDAFASAETLGPAVPLTVPGSNADATPEPSEPSHGEDPPTTSVWYSWTPSFSGHAKLNLCDSSGGKPFAVYTGSALASLVRVIDTHSGGCSRNFSVDAGTTYRIAVDSHAGSSGTFNLTLLTASPPPNDDFDGAQAIGPNMPININSTNLDATAEPGEPLIAQGAPRKTVWFSWTAPSHGVSIPTIDVCNGEFTAWVDVFVGNSVDMLTPVDPEDGTYYCHFTFEASPGTVYRIAVDGHLAFPNVDEGSFNLIMIGPVGPLNDNFGSAQLLGPGIPLSVPGSNVLATDEVGEPQHFPGLPPFFSVWYVWTAPSTGPIRLDTCSSNFDSVLAVYSGTSLGGLTQLGSSDDGVACQSTGNDLGSSVQLNVVTGTQYRIAVDGYDEGSFTLGILATGPHTIPSLPAPAQATKRCPKGKKLKKGKCVKKKRKRRR